MANADKYLTLRWEPRDPIALHRKGDHYKLTEVGAPEFLSIIASSVRS